MCPAKFASREGGRKVLLVHNGRDENGLTISGRQNKGKEDS